MSALNKRELKKLAKRVKKASNCGTVQIKEGEIKDSDIKGSHRVETEIRARKFKVKRK